MIVVGAADEAGQIAAKRDPRHVRRDPFGAVHSEKAAARLMANADDGVFGQETASDGLLGALAANGGTLPAHTNLGRRRVASTAMPLECL